MKTVVTTYTFTPAQKKIDFTGYSGFDARRLLAVIHVPSGALLFVAGTSPALGTFAGSVLTLAADTTSMGASDPLTVLYDADLWSAATPAHVTLDAQAAGLGLDASLQAILTRLGQALSVSVGNFPATQAVSGTLAATQSGAWTVGVNALPALPAGTNSIGSVAQSGAWSMSVSGTVAVTQSGSWGVSLLAGSAAIGTVGVTSLPSLPAGGNAIGSVSVSNLPATQPVSAVALPLPAGASQDGTDATGVTAPTGGAGIRGWLSGIYSRLGGILTVSWTGQSVGLTGSLPAGTNALGSVSVSNLPATQAVSGTVATTVADGGNATIGAKADAPAADDTSAASLVALVRRGLARWTLLLARLPAALGRAAAASSFAVALSNEDLAAVVATGPGSDGFTVTPSDTVNFTKNARALYVGSSGDVSLLTPAGTTLLHKNVPAGAVLPIGAARVNATNTTASSILGYI